jgi:hypothetical protein
LARNLKAAFRYHWNEKHTNYANQHDGINDEDEQQDPLATQRDLLDHNIDTANMLFGHIVSSEETTTSGVDASASASGSQDIVEEHSTEELNVHGTVTISHNRRFAFQSCKRVCNADAMEVIQRLSIDGRPTNMIAIDVTVNPTDHPNSLVDVGEKRFRTRYGILKDASTSHHATGKRKYGKVVWQPPGLADSVHSAATEKRVTFHTDHIAAIFNIVDATDCPVLKKRSLIQKDWNTITSLVNIKCSSNYSSQQIKNKYNTPGKHVRLSATSTSSGIPYLIITFIAEYCRCHNCTYDDIR